MKEIHLSWAFQIAVKHVCRVMKKRYGCKRQGQWNENLLKPNQDRYLDKYNVNIEQSFDE